jgi:hypothetical protein
VSHRYPPLPAEYRNYLTGNGAFEGFTFGDPGYIALWTLEDIPRNNADLQVHELAPGYVAFAGNGGGEVLAFDESGAVFMLPMIGMEPQYAIRIADSFVELAARFEIGA